MISLNFLLEMPDWPPPAAWNCDLQWERCWVEGLASWGEPGEEAGDRQELELPIPPAQRCSARPDCLNCQHCRCNAG